MQQVLLDWNGHASVQSVAYRIVRSFRLEVMKQVLSGLTAKVKSDYPEFEIPRLSQAEHAVWKLIEQRPLHLLPADDSDWDSMLAACARRIAEQMQAQPGGIVARNWGEENTADIRHPFSRALPSWIAAWLNMPADQLPGDHHMPRVPGTRFWCFAALRRGTWRGRTGLFRNAGRPERPSTFSLLRQRSFRLGGRKASIIHARRSTTDFVSPSGRIQSGSLMDRYFLPV